MKKILTKTNISLLIIVLCSMLFCGFIFANNFITREVPTSHAESSATLKGWIAPVGSSYPRNSQWWYGDSTNNLGSYTIQNLMVTTNDNKKPAEGAFVAKWNASEDGVLQTYIVQTQNGYDCVVYGDVDKIYAPENSRYLFGQGEGEENLNDSVFWLKELVSLTFEGFDTSNVTSMYGMFMGCVNLQTLDLSSFVTTSVTDMSFMFMACESLIELDLSMFNTNSVTNMGGMFADCSSLQTINFGNNFNTSNVQYFVSADDPGYGDQYTIPMFGGCTNLQTLDLSKFDLSSAVLHSYKFISGELEGTDEDIYLFGMSEDVLYAECLEQSGGQLPCSSYDEILEFMTSQVGGDAGLCMLMLLKSVRITSNNLTEIKTPVSMGTKSIVLSTTPGLYVNGEGDTPEAKITSANENSTLLVKNTSDDTPNTGFVSEQLLPQIAIGFLSVVVMAFVGNKRKYLNK